MARTDRGGLALPEMLALRSRVLQAVRGFLAARGCVEVETPVRLPAPALELHIDAEPSGAWFLRTSPELHMKRLLADGLTALFQLGPCFRHGERGAHHRPEYTMLEWYRAGAGYLDILAETRDLLLHVAREAIGSTRVPARPGGVPVDLAAPWCELRVAEAFRRWAGWDPVERYDADRFDLDLVQRVEPALPADRPAVLLDYPVEAAALARCRPGPPAVAERWELYAAGLELANAFGELTDPDEQARRFAACAEARRALGKPVYPPDTEFLEALRRGLPPCAGVALGVDRLVMLLAGAETIDAVCAF